MPVVAVLLPCKLSAKCFQVKKRLLYFFLRCAVLVWYANKHSSCFWGRQETIACGLHWNKIRQAAWWSSSRERDVSVYTPMRVSHIEADMECIGTPENNGSHFRLDHIPLKMMLIPTATINTSWPVPSVIHKEAQLLGPVASAGVAKARGNFLFVCFSFSFSI